MYLATFAIVSVLIGSGFADSWPSDILRCKYEDSACISKISSTIVQNYGANGLPSIGLPKYDPIFVPSIVVTEATNGPVKLDLALKDVTADGLSTISVDHSVGFGKDPATTTFELYAFMKKFHLVGKYKVGGQILVLPINGEGDCEFSFADLKASIKFKPTVTEKDGKKYLTVTQVKILLEPESLKIRLENLFNGDKALGETTNTFLNENWKDVWGELSESVNKAVASVIKEHLISVFKKFPYEDYFSE